MNYRMTGQKMLLVEDIDSKEYLTGLFNAMYDELPVHKIKQQKEIETRQKKISWRES